MADNIFGGTLDTDLDFDGEATGSADQLGGWTEDLSQGMFLKFTAVMSLDAEVPPGPPPANLVIQPLRLSSYVFPAPTLDGNGLPVNWEPTSSNLVEWGYLQVVFGNTDVTWYRGVTAQVKSWSVREPFGYGPAEIGFPQITPFEALPVWMKDWTDVKIILVRPDTTTKILWEGIFVDEEDSISSSGGELSVQLMGALFQADLYLMPPKPFGYPTLTDIGHIIAHELHPQNHPNARWLPPNVVTMGITAQNSGSWDPLLTGYIQGLLSKCTLSDGSNQYTVDCLPGRQPYVKLKDRTTEHWVTRVGVPGVTHQLKRDLTTVRNVIYGEGTSPDLCHWRNTRYPNLLYDNPPIFAGTVLSPSSVDPENRKWKQQAYDNGRVGLTIDDTYHPLEEDIVRQIQTDAGITVDGEVGPQTWAVIFEVGQNAGDLSGAYFFPIYVEQQVEPFLYNPSGAIIGSQTLFDPAAIRVEGHEVAGHHITPNEFSRSLVAKQLQIAPAGYMGTITMDADFENGSRWEARAGENIKFKGHRGVTRMLHISNAELDWGGQTATYTVSEQALDMNYIHSILERERENSDPAKRPQRQYRNSRTTRDDRAEWDCENGSGLVPMHGTYAGLWNIVRIPAGEAGNIVRSDFAVQIAARFSVAVFDRPVTANFMASRGVSPLDDNYWDGFGEDTGLIIAWGGSGQGGGFWPGQESDDDPLTGRMIDDASWYFHTTVVPWLWVACWVESPTINYITGRLFAGVA